MDNVRLIISAVDQSSSVLQQIKGNVSKMADGAKKSVSVFTDSIEKNRENLESLRNTSALASAGLIAIGVSSLGTAGKFEKYRAVLSLAMGSQEEAIKTMEMIKDVAAKTPFELGALTESYTRLVNAGITPTREELIKLGDIASSQGKSFSQFSEALLDAKTFQFERLKEFGIATSVSGDAVSFTFKGMTSTVKKTDKEIQKYLISLGELNGIQGISETVAGTLEGKISNLGDVFSNLKLIIGEQLLPIAKPFIDFMISAVTAVGSFVSANPQLVATLLLVGTALATSVAALVSLALIIPSVISGIGFLTVGFGVLWAAITGPIGLVIASIGLLFLAYQTNFLGIQTIIDSVVGGVFVTIPTARNMVVSSVSAGLSSLYNSFQSIRTSIQLVLDVAWFAISMIVQGGLDNINSYVNSFYEFFSSTRQLFWDGISLGFTMIFDTIVLYFSNVLLSIQTARTAFTEPFLLAFSGIWNTARSIFTATREAIKKQMIGVIDFLVLFFTSDGRAKIAEGFTAMFSDVAGIIKGIVNGVIGGFEWMVNGAIAMVNTLIDALNQVNIASGLTGAISNIGRVTLPRFASGGLVDNGVMREYAQQFATGGMVTGPQGIDRVPAMLTAGELVLNKSQQQNLAGQLQGGGGQNVYITFSPQMYGSKEGMAEEMMDTFMRQFKSHTTFESF